MQVREMHVPPYRLLTIPLSIDNKCTFSIYPTKQTLGRSKETQRFSGWIHLSSHLLIRHLRIAKGTGAEGAPRNCLWDGYWASTGQLFWLLSRPVPGNSSRRLVKVNSAQFTSRF